MFGNFVEECRKNQIILVTNAAVTTEFSKGSDTAQIFIEKSALVNNLIDYLLPILPDVFNVEIPWLTEQYGQIGKSVSTTDFILAAQTKMHPNDLCLVTKNPKDFPTSIFSVQTYFLLQLERGLQVYGVYFYEHGKAKETENSDEIIVPF